jgi:hypothetical protein
VKKPADRSSCISSSVFSRNLRGATASWIRASPRKCAARAAARVGIRRPLEHELRPEVAEQLLHVVLLQVDLGLGARVADRRHGGGPAGGGATEAAAGSLLNNSRQRNDLDLVNFVELGEAP